MKRALFALVAGLIVFAAGVVYANLGSGQASATAVVRLGSVQPNNGQEPGDAALPARLASRDQLPGVLRTIDQRRGLPDDAVHAAKREQLAASLSAKITPVPGSEGTAAARQLTVTYTGKVADAAAKVVHDVAEQIAEEYADAVLAPLHTRRDAAGTTAEDARQDWTAAQAALETAIADHLAAVETVASQAAAESRRVEPPESETDPPSSENPAWSELAEKVSAIEAELATLRETKTAAHPLVLSAAWRLAQAKHRLDQTPRYLDGAANRTESRPIADRPTADPTSDTVAIAAAAVQQRKSRLAETHKQYQTALAAERAAESRLQAARATLVGQVRTTTTTVSHAPARQPILWIAAVAALLVSLGVAVSGSRRPRILKTIDEAQKRLSMPVIGVVSTR